MNRVVLRYGAQLLWHIFARWMRSMQRIYECIRSTYIKLNYIYNICIHIYAKRLLWSGINCLCKKNMHITYRAIICVANKKLPLADRPLEPPRTLYARLGGGYALHTQTHWCVVVFVVRIAHGVVVVIIINIISSMYLICAMMDIASQAPIVAARVDENARSDRVNNNSSGIHILFRRLYICRTEYICDEWPRASGSSICGEHEQPWCCPKENICADMQIAGKHICTHGEKGLHFLLLLVACIRVIHTTWASEYEFGNKENPGATGNFWHVREQGARIRPTPSDILY